MTTTTTIFDSAATTKPRTFGKGLHRSVPFGGRMPFTSADEAAYVEMMAADRAYDRAIERMASEAAALARLESGFDA